MAAIAPKESTMPGDPGIHLLVDGGTVPLPTSWPRSKPHCSRIIDQSGIATAGASLIDPHDAARAGKRIASMATLEDLKPNAAVRGVLATSMVTVVSAPCARHR